MLKELLKDEEGQSTVEYMLLISVIVIAIVAAAYVFIEPFKQGVLDLGKDIKKTKVKFLFNICGVEDLPLLF